MGLYLITRWARSPASLTLTLAFRLIHLRPGWHQPGQSEQHRPGCVHFDQAAWGHSQGPEGPGPLPGRRSSSSGQEVASFSCQQKNIQVVTFSERSKRLREDGTHLHVEENKCQQGGIHTSKAALAKCLLNSYLKVTTAPLTRPAAAAFLGKWVIFLNSELLKARNDNDRSKHTTHMWRRRSLRDRHLNHW